MTQSQKIIDYLNANPEYLTGHYAKTAKKFNTTYESIRHHARKIRNKTTIAPADLKQSVVTPEGYIGKLKSGKMWQVYDGSWRESLQFDIDRIKEFNEFKDSFINGLENLHKISSNTKVKKDGDVAIEIALPDMHFGKGDVDDTVSNYLTIVDLIIKRTKGFNVDKFIFPIGNDGLNSEGKRKSTTAGTPQEDSVDWQTSFRCYWTCLIAAINKLEEIAPVEVVIVNGNHDEERMFYIGDVLNAYYMSHKNVIVHNDGSYRKYVQYGTNMLMWTHGDKEKHADLPLIMATERPEMFAATKFREAHCGHFHKEMIQEYRGIKVRFLPSICPTDKWHTMMGYSALRAGQALIWDKTKGFQGLLQINVDTEIGLV